MDADEMTVRKNAIRKKIESGEFDEMSNKELKNIISEILAEGLISQSQVEQKPD